jgi:anti-anti-sigma regulatory factor
LSNNEQEPIDLSIEGELSTRTVSKRLAELLASLRDAGELRLELSNLTRMDVCGVQLIEAARKFAEANGKSLLLKSPAGPDLEHLLDGLGLLHASCASNRAFWLHEGARP